VKRDIRLLDKVVALDNINGCRITVLDISMDSNKEPLLDLLNKECTVEYFDHHFAGEIPNDERLESFINPSAQVCTGLIVNDRLGNKYPAWAVTAAFGDNLHDSATQLATQIGLSETEISHLRELGELLNYNGYGRDVTDLHFSPDDLYKAVKPFENPLHFYSDSEDLAVLQQGFADDMARARSVSSEAENDHARIFVFPAESWSQRAIGVIANEKAREQPNLAHALLVDNGKGGFVVSVRAPLSNKQGAVEFCKQFPTGGGRAAAAGVNNLPQDDFDKFTALFLKNW
jgi:hypothetical protein